MIFGEQPLAEAEGALLAHSLVLGGRRIAKGTPIGPDLVADARAAGIARLWTARVEPSDVPEGQAASRIASALAGEGVEARPPVHGRVNLHATARGILGAHAIEAANRVSDVIGIATLAPATPVAPGQLLATVKIIPFAVPGMLLERIEAQGARLVVHAFREGLAARLIPTSSTSGPANPGADSKATRITRDRLGKLGVHLAEAPAVPHAVEDLARAIAAAAEPLLLISGAAATSDRHDVIPAAIEAAGGRVLRVGMPVDPGNLLVLGERLGTTIIGLPGCARSPKRNGLDLVLERWAAGLRVDSDVIASMGVGGLLEGSGQPVPWAWTG